MCTPIPVTWPPGASSYLFEPIPISLSFPSVTIYGRIPLLLAPLFNSSRQSILNLQVSSRCFVLRLPYPIRGPLKHRFFSHGLSRSASSAIDTLIPPRRRGLAWTELAIFSQSRNFCPLETCGHWCQRHTPQLRPPSSKGTFDHEVSALRFNPRQPLYAGLTIGRTNALINF